MVNTPSDTEEEGVYYQVLFWSTRGFSAIGGHREKRKQEALFALKHLEVIFS